MAEELDLEFDVAKVKLFKVLLVEYISNNFTPCSNFKKSLENCEDEDAITKLFSLYKTEVFEHLGGFDYEDELRDLESEVRDLRDENDSLEEELDLYKGNLTNNLNDDYKAQVFQEYQSKYTPWELEELLKNGKL